MTCGNGKGMDQGETCFPIASKRQTDQDRNGGIAASRAPRPPLGEGSIPAIVRSAPSENHSQRRTLPGMTTDRNRRGDPEGGEMARRLPRHPLALERSQVPEKPARSFR